MQNPEEVAKFLNSVEGVLYTHLLRVSMAYQRLLNARALIEAEAALREVSSAAQDFEVQVRKILEVHHQQITWGRDMSQWTRKTLDNKLMNMTQFYNRYLHSSPANKISEMTVMYYLVKDVAELSTTVRPEQYYSNAIAILERA